MRLFEYQGKELFAQYGIRVPAGFLLDSKDEAIEAAARVGYPVVLKSQVTVGGRGKAGAILKCNRESELLPKFDELMKREVKGELPRGILIEEMVDIKNELYLSFFLNRSRRSYSLIVSAEGGIEIESVGSKTIFDIPIDGLSREVSQDAALQVGLEGKTATSFVDFSLKLSKLVVEKEAELAEVNPAAILNDDSFVALDAKVVIDDNAMFRHPELKKYEHVSELEKQAEKSGFSLVELDGNIAIVGNGAGLVMSTVDMVTDVGGLAGSFLDFGGRATTETIYEALRVISKIKRIKAILVNLFGGIVKTNLVAQAILYAYKDNLIDIPVFARISGAESDKAREMLRGSKAKLYDTVEDAIQAVVRQVS